MSDTTNPCWIGKCAGCGRTLISATWNSRNNKDAKMARYGYRKVGGKDVMVFCTRACRAAHEADTPKWWRTAERRAKL